jgi:hypothetical protein
MQAEFHLTCLINANPVQFPTFGACGNPSRVLSIVRCTLLTKRRPWFHSTICEMLEHLFSGDTMPTPFHFCLEKLALEHRLIRNYTQTPLKSDPRITAPVAAARIGNDCMPSDPGLTRRGQNANHFKICPDLQRRV